MSAIVFWVSQIECLSLYVKVLFLYDSKDPFLSPSCSDFSSKQLVLWNMKQITVTRRMQNSNWDLCQELSEIKFCILTLSLGKISFKDHSKNPLSVRNFNGKCWQEAMLFHLRHITKWSNNRWRGFKFYFCFSNAKVCKSTEKSHQRRKWIISAVSNNFHFASSKH